MVPSLARWSVVGLGLWSLLGCTPRPVVRCQPTEPLKLAGAGCPEGMVGVAGGSFAMRNPKDAKTKDLVTVANFCMDRAEVTVNRYLACVHEGKCSAQHLDSSSADGKSFSFERRCNAPLSGQGNHPINCVSFEQAATFCDAADGRLPTEEEWEWAARGGACGRDYPWEPARWWESSTLEGRVCWLRNPGLDGTCAVGSFPAGDSPIGIHDLAGNVWEWTASKYDTEERVIRGGSWMLRDTSAVKASFRYGYAPAVQDSDLGFRCVRNIP
jgi:formylglycine-generating enzyme required for sulfatase activity